MSWQQRKYHGDGEWEESTSGRGIQRRGKDSGSWSLGGKRTTGRPFFLLLTSRSCFLQFSLTSYHSPTQHPYLQLLNHFPYPHTRSDKMTGRQGGKQKPLKAPKKAQKELDDVSNTNRTTRRVRRTDGIMFLRRMMLPSNRSSELV
jgi:hypothetical protein